MGMLQGAKRGIYTIPEWVFILRQVDELMSR
jgi:hypothetical protein